ncbi:hypothetical protein [Paenarthrobacter sp. PH39-S1]|uniref:hypothetical protein n=1 Tax=Paenarthrobacter sp. PH39-S1 TaxID=3046204 RepID=UPI0024BB051D|nr:hypothetical protein [Paenarthrobacter sp. PH39-S1]MDJ0354800.1 hypothetical protein [Paenarthrobacter sp. PH39-S1]
MTAEDTDGVQGATLIAGLDQALPDQTAPDQTPHDDADRGDLNKLLGTALGIAQEQLEAHGAFLPVALAVGDDGGIRMLTVSPAGAESGPHADGPESASPEADSPEAASPEADGGLDADAMIADLYEVLRQQKDVHRAAAMVCDIHLPDEGTDAIHVVTEHRSGVCVAAVQAYTRTPGWNFSEPVWEAEEPQIWI